MEKIALITFGCAKNLVDSEVMLGYLNKAGYRFVSTPDKGDIIILNTCGFIRPAKEEAEEAIQKAISLKKSTKIKKIIAAGCYVQRYKDKLMKQYPEIDCFMGVNDFDRIVEAVKGKPFKWSQQCFLYDHTSPRFLSTPPSWTYVKISEGCSHRCSFCTIPLIKGPYKSRPISSIIREVRQLDSHGIKEINLISQDTTFYGRDRGIKQGLTALLQKLLDTKKEGWIRILYGYPEEINDSLLEVMNEEKICSYLDIPFQHSHPSMIKKMYRGMDSSESLKLIKKIRKKLPDVSLRTTLIVGFPGEGKKEFENLINFVRDAQFDHLGVFTYSKEEETSSYVLGDPVKEQTKIERRNRILDIQSEISRKNNMKYLGKQIPVIMEGAQKDNPDILIGRSQFQAPEVDGIIIMNKPESSSAKISKLEKAEIIDTDVYDLFGEIVK
ncbi:MAG: 30S ribosomal protein S12 methylthiotransferase RimO [Candidatus Aminicenantaceae bacterium]